MSDKFLDKYRNESARLQSWDYGNNGIGGITGHHNPMLHENISRVVRCYKGRCSFEIRKIHSDFAWQSRFHDHIIRNTVANKRITNYIANNPVYWEKDTLNLH